MSNIHYKLSNRAATLIANGILNSICSRYKDEYPNAPDDVKQAWDKILRVYMYNDTSSCILDTTNTQYKNIEMYVASVCVSVLLISLYITTHSVALTVLLCAFLIGIYITMSIIVQQQKRNRYAAWRKSHIAHMSFMLNKSSCKFADNIVVAGIYVYPRFMKTELFEMICNGNPYITDGIQTTDMNAYYIVCKYLKIRFKRTQFHSSDLTPMELNDMIEVIY